MLGIREVLILVFQKKALQQNVLVLPCLSFEMDMKAQISQNHYDIQGKKDPEQWSCF